MAVSVQNQFHTHPIWNSSDIQSPFSDVVLDAPTNSMAHQYPLGSSGMEPSPNINKIFHHHPEHGSPSNSPSMSQATSPGHSSRASGGGIRPGKIKRSTSTPNVRGQASADAAALALSAEKRRNKLGYHRTSVACGHCRRRKIRCIPAPGDPQSRCINCIRLKKECTFHPVDQQPQADPNLRDSKPQSGMGRASESSSPTASSGNLAEMHTYSQMTMPPIQDLGGPHMKRQRTESFSPETKVVTSSRNFEYNHGNTNWMAADVSPGAKPPSDIQNSYWRGPQESPLTPAFSPFTPNHHIPPVHSWPVNHPEPSPREELSWSVPQRSTSYGNLEHLQSSHHHSNYPPPPPPPGNNYPSSDHFTTKPRVLGSYPPPLSTSGGSHPAALTSDLPHHSQSAGALPPVNYPQWQQPYSYQKPLVTSSEPYSSWNSSHGGHHSIPEEGQATLPGFGYADSASNNSYYPPPPHQHGR